MDAGEAWIFDNWREHAVYNNSPIDRIHLVIDTAGSADFWKLAHSAWNPASSEPRPAPRTVPPDPSASPLLNFEMFNRSVVRHPAEMAEMLRDLVEELRDSVAADRPELVRFTQLGDQLVQDWRCLWLLHADSVDGIPHFDSLLRDFRR